MKGYEPLVKSLFESMQKQKWLVEQIPKAMIGIRDRETEPEADAETERD